MLLCLPASALRSEGTSAGTILRNWANADFRHMDGEVLPQTTSATLIAIVSNVNGIVRISQPPQVGAAADTTNIVSYTVVNGGNAPDRFSIQFVKTNRSSPGQTPWSYAVCVDGSGTGVWNPSTVLTNGAGFDIAENAQLPLLVRVAVAADATNWQQESFVFRLFSSGRTTGHYTNILGTLYAGWPSLSNDAGFTATNTWVVIRVPLMEVSKSVQVSMSGLTGFKGI